MSDICVPCYFISFFIFFRFWFHIIMIHRNFEILSRTITLCNYVFLSLFMYMYICCYRYFDVFIPPLPNGGGGYTGLPLSVCSFVLPSVQDIFRRIFLSNCSWQESDILLQALYRYTILWVVFLDLSDSYFLFADLVGFYTH